MEYGDSLSYKKIDDDGDGTYDCITIYRYKGSAVSFEIPSEIDGLPVTEIGREAFWNSTITSIVIPDSVTSIGYGAFDYTSLPMDQGVKYADKWAVSCSNDDTVEIKPGTKGIADFAFSGRRSLTSVVIPDGVIYIGEGAFSECTSLTNVEIPDSVTFVEMSSFIYTPFLNNQTGVKYAGKCVISCDADVTEAEIKSGTKVIADFAFSGRRSLTSVVIPDGVIYIGEGAFSECTSLTNVEIPDNVTYIGEYAFSGCKSLTSIEIPDDVTYIRNSTFSKCTGLTSVEIPSSVTKIRKNVFLRCSGLKSINVSENNLNYSSLDGVLFNKDKTKLLQCPADINLKEYVIPNSVTYIESYAFYECVGLTSVEIPNSVTEIGSVAFSCCESLTNVEISDSITKIGMNTFSDCKSLTSVEIPNSVTEIGNRAFYQCESLTSITIKNPECEIYYNDSLTICNKTHASKYGDDEEGSFNGTIYGYEDSTAQRYAKKCGYKFENISNKPLVTTAPPTTTVSGTSVAVNDDWKTAYKNILKDYDNITFDEYDPNGKPTYISYSIYDINNDSIPELILSGMQNGLRIKIYTWDNKNGVSNTGNVPIKMPVSIGVLTNTNKFTIKGLNQSKGTNYFINVDINGNTTEVDYDSNKQAYSKLEEIKLTGSDASSNPTEYIDKWTANPVTTPATTTTSKPITTTATTATTLKTAAGSSAATKPVTTGAAGSSAATAAIETTTVTVTTAANAGIAVPAGATATKHGDINGDEGINISDVVAINLFILNQKKYPLEDTAIANADCVRDNVINASDSTILMNYVAEIIDISELGK